MAQAPVPVAMGTYLEPILESTRARLEESRRRVPYRELEQKAETQDPPRDFLEAIRAPGMSLVAELKRRSPSAGEIRTDAEASQTASVYEGGGARAISVLTEPEFFSGSLQDLQAARASCSVSVLRKDFLIDHYQLVESRAAGADAVLLIVAAFEDRGLIRELVTATSEIGMTGLIEVHDENELDIGLEAGASLIGVNQRDLVTFEVDTELAARLRPRVPDGTPVIAESGIATRGDVARLDAAGLDGILVGESLMRASDPAAAIAELLGRPVA